MYRKSIVIIFCITSAMVLWFAEPSFAKRKIIFAGGSEGGTFQVMANSIQIYKPVKVSENFTVKSLSTKGSIENLRKIDGGKADFGMVYGKDFYLARNGMLKNDSKKYENVLAVAYLYGATAHLVVHFGLGVKNTGDLAGKKVGVCDPESGDYMICEMFFNHLNLLDKIEKIYLGYNDAAVAFSNNHLDAFWLLTGFPSDSVTMAAQTSKIVLINLDTDAENSDFYRKFPYFSKRVIPVGTYKGVYDDTASFYDSVLWVANAKIPNTIVYELLSIIYSPEGLNYITSRKKTFEEIRIENSVKNVNAPFHPGAEKFWQEKGVLKVSDKMPGDD